MKSLLPQRRQSLQTVGQREAQRLRGKAGLGPVRLEGVRWPLGSHRGNGC